MGQLHSETTSSHPFLPRSAFEVVCQNKNPIRYRSLIEEDELLPIVRRREMNGRPGVAVIPTKRSEQNSLTLSINFSLQSIGIKLAEPVQALGRWLSFQRRGALKRASLTISSDYSAYAVFLPLLLRSVSPWAYKVFYFTTDP